MADFEKAGLTVTLQLDGSTCNVSAAVGLALYRITQESLTNIAKHAPGTRSTVVLDVSPRSARLAVDPHLVRALAWMESGFQTRIVSDAGARGVLQTLPTTRVYVETVLAGRRLPRTVDGDIEVGILYLRHLLRVFHGDESLALAGWYQGERAVREHGVYNVSKPFVANVLALRTRM